MRQGQRVAKATQDEGAGDRRERNCQHLKKKKRNDAPGVCSVALRIYERKGRGVVKQKGTTPLAACQREGSPVYL